MLLSTIFALAIINFQFPAAESIVYRTEEKGKVGYLNATMVSDDSTIQVTYTSDRVVETVIDYTDFKTRWVRKIINGKRDYEFERNGDTIRVFYRGEKRIYHNKNLIYDRHTLDYVLRVPRYDSAFKQGMYVHLPELGVKKATLSVAGDTIVNTELGEVPCWRVELMARILFFKLKLYFLIEKAYPHRYIKYDDAKRKMEIVKYRSAESSE